MNKHFEDALYYLKRSGEHTKLGIEETVESARSMVRGPLGREEPAPSRTEKVVSILKGAERRGANDVRNATESIRKRLTTGRSSE